MTSAQWFSTFVLGRPQMFFKRDKLLRRESYSTGNKHVF